MADDDLTIAEQVLIRAMRDAQGDRSEANPDGALTTKDLRRITGWGDERVRNTLHVLDKKGMLAQAQVYEFDLAKRWMPKVAYKIKTGQLGELIAEMQDKGETDAND